MKNIKECKDVQTIKISKKLHTNIKEYCKKNNLKMGGWVETLIKNELKKYE